MMPREQFRPYMTILELLPPMPADKAEWRKAYMGAQEYLQARDVESVPPDTVPFIAIVDWWIGRLEKAKAMCATNHIIPVYHQTNNIPDLLDFEIFAPTSDEGAKGGQSNAAKPG